jgi:hypothetical protein
MTTKTIARLARLALTLDVADGVSLSVSTAAFDDGDGLIREEAVLIRGPGYGVQTRLGRTEAAAKEALRRLAGV